MLANREKKCVDGYLGQASLRSPLAWKCDWTSVLQGLSANQLWQWDVGKGSEGVPDKRGASSPRSEGEEEKAKEQNNTGSERGGDSLTPRKPGPSSLYTGRIFSFSHPDALSLTGHDTIPVFKPRAISDRSRCLVVEDASSPTDNKKSESETKERKKIPVRWRACNGLPLAPKKKKKTGEDEEGRDKGRHNRAPEGRQKEEEQSNKKDQEKEEEEEGKRKKTASSILDDDESIEIDPMKFVPLWILPPLSSRFGVRTIGQAIKITDEEAEKYLHSRPRFIDA